MRFVIPLMNLLASTGCVNKAGPQWSRVTIVLLVICHQSGTSLAPRGARYNSRNSKYNAGTTLRQSCEERKETANVSCEHNSHPLAVRSTRERKSEEWIILSGIHRVSDARIMARFFGNDIARARQIEKDNNSALCESAIRTSLRPTGEPWLLCEPFCFSVALCALYNRI